MNKSLKILISGGGTGGHIFPAIAIADEIKARRPDADILFVGAEGKMEMEKVPQSGYPIEGLPVVGFVRNNLFANWNLPFKLIKSIRKAYKIVKNHRADIVIGVGGFASGPTLKMANWLKVKTLLQEQNSYAGITNKILAKNAEKVCVAYPGMERFFPKEKIVLTGNPVRQNLETKLSQVESLQTFGLNPNKKTILIIGGSLGAKSINQAVVQNLEKWLKNLEINIIWQTGKLFKSEIDSLKFHLTTSRCYVSEFIHEMDKAYKAADLVISRAGALSVSELALLGKAAILVPYPYASEDHQTANAMNLVQRQAAILISDAEVSQRLGSQVIELIQNPSKIKELENAIVTFSKPHAVKEIVDCVLKITDDK